MLHETVAIPEATTKAARERAERDAYKEAQKVLTRLQAEADSLKVARTKATVGALLERWMQQHEIDATTRMTYESQIRMHVRPNIGDVTLCCSCALRPKDSSPSPRPGRTARRGVGGNGGRRPSRSDAVGALAAGAAAWTLLDRGDSN